MRYYLAIDIGASSGRHILGHVENGRIILEEVYRFENKQVRRNGHDCWDMENLWNGILSGLKQCKALGKVPATVGIDTWAVDFVLLDGQDAVIGDAVAYRDSRTEGMNALVNQIIPASELYARTGIQYQPFNTIYQLMALKQEHPEQLKRAKWLLMIPEYFNFRLCGVKQNEYTSLSACYRDAIRSLEKLTGKHYTSVNIVGGGCQDSYLNERTARAAGLPVYAGPVEGTAIGNLTVQMIQAGEFENLQEARNAIRASFEIKEVNP